MIGIRRTSARRWSRGVVALSALAATAWTAWSDDGPRSRIQYTVARQTEVRRQIELPGTVEAPKSSQVASEVEGAVERLHAREGEYVRKGAPLVSLKSEHLEIAAQAAEAQHREAEARLGLAERNLTRSRDLFESQVLSQQQLDDALFELDAWRGRVDQLAAELRRIRLDQERSVVKAPFSGIVASELTEVGQWVGKGTTVVELVSPAQLEVRVEVPERHFGSIRKGSAVDVRFDAIPGYEVEGKVVSLVPRASGNARTFPLRIQVGNDDGRLGAGMLAKVSINAGDRRSARLVPKDALITRGTKRFVYLVEANDTVSLVPVETGVARGSWVEVEGELPDDARVVTRGNERIQPGQQVLAEAVEYPAP